MSNDGMLLLGLTLLSMILFIPLLICYIFLSVWSSVRK